MIIKKALRRWKTQSSENGNWIWEIRHFLVSPGNLGWATERSTCGKEIRSGLTSSQIL
jgi:hypothetical protein